MVVKRTHGSDGTIGCSYTTIELDKSSNTARAGIDFTHVKGKLEFGHGEVEKEIKVPILEHKDADPNEERDEIFGIKIFDPYPEIVKISSKNVQIVEIVTDAEKKKQADSLQQLLDKINREEKISWGQQFINACLLHPVKNEDGVIQDISGMDAILHFMTIGWKFLFATCPPPHMLGGWACFIIAIVWIGIVTYVVGEIAGLMGCVMGIKPGVTAITFVAIGTSLPDTFASMTAAKESRYADSAVGNVTGSNSVNVFLGLGLPWVIAVIYSSQNDTVYEVPAKGLGLSVILYLSCSLIGIVILVVRRCICKGELGGSSCGRWSTALMFFALWFIYIIISILVQYEYLEINI